LASEPVKVLVGEANTPFYVHETLLRANGPFFDNAFKGPWKEREERTITLTETDPETFNIYLQWLYTARLFCTKEDDERDDADSVAGILYREIERWSHCYKLADFLQSSDFKDALIDTAIEKMIKERCHSTSLPNIIYKYSSKDSVHRKMVVDTIVYIWGRADWENYLYDRSTKICYTIYWYM
jgi:hypothetical protein